MKTTVTIVLLTFVAASVVFLAVGESASKSEAPAALPQEGKAAPTRNNPAPERADSQEVPAQAPALIAYYFHGTARCPTCLNMERYAREAVEQTFAVEVKAGTVRWLAVNYDRPANEHFVKQYALTASAVVLAPQGEGDQGRWRNLTRIWDLAGDEAAFKTYVANELANLLRGES